MPTIDGGSSDLIARERHVLAITRALAEGRGVAIVGPPASGVSALLHVVLRDVRGQRRPAIGDVAELPGLPAREPDDAAVPVLFVDDADRLDASSADAIARATLLGRVVPVVASTNRASPVMSRLRSSAALLDISIEPFDATAVHDLVQTMTGAEPDGATIRRLSSDSGGLPGLLVPTVRASTEDGSIVVSHGVARLRGQLAVATPVIERVAAWRAVLSAEADTIVDEVCVGRTLLLAWATAVYDIGALAEVEHAGLITVDEIEGVIEPSCDAVGRAVRAELGRFGTARVARALVARMPDAPSARRVHWRVLAGDEPVADELEAAAAAAQRRGDLSSAHDLAGRAWRAGAAGGGLLLAEVTAALGDRAGAAHVLDQLLAQPAADAELQAAAALELATLYLWNLGEPDRAVALAAEVATTSAGTPLEAMGHSALGAMLLYSGRCAEAVDAVAPYVDAPAATQALSCQVAATALALQGNGTRAIELGRRALRAGVHEPAAPGTVDAEIIVVSLALALELAGQLDEADRLSVDWYDRAAERSVHHAWLALVRMRVMLLRGELPRAAGFAGEAAAIFDDLDNQAPLRWALAGQMLAAAQMDERDLAVRLAERLDAVGPSGVTFLDTEVERARAWLLASDGRLDEARRVLAASAARAESNGLVALAAAAWHDVVRLGGRGEAPERLRDLAARTTGELCGARSEHADACGADDPAGLLDAAQRLETIGCVLLAAEAAAHAVAAAQRQGETATARAATARLRELRMRCSAAATPALVEVPMASLTPRERDVARLAASGLTSRAIAERLTLSVRTVDNLLQRAYMKLGVSGRRELPRVLGRPPA